VKVIAWNVSDLRKRGVGGQLGNGDYSFLLHAQKCIAKRIAFSGFVFPSYREIHYKKGNYKKNMFF